MTKVNSITFYIELSSKSVGLAVYFVLLIETIFSSFFQKVKNSLWNKNKTLRFSMSFFLNIQFTLELVFLFLGELP